MADLKICRICLRTEVKGYKFDLHQLKSFYEEVTASKVDISDGLPQWFCYECSFILYKYHKFKEKCYLGQKLLKEMLRNGPLTYQLIYKSEYPKQFRTLQTITCTDRIKNYLVKYTDKSNISKTTDKTNITLIKTNTEDVTEQNHSINMPKNDNLNISEEHNSNMPEDLANMFRDNNLNMPLDNNLSNIPKKHDLNMPKQYNLANTTKDDNLNMPKEHNSLNIPEDHNLNTPEVKSPEQIIIIDNKMFELETEPLTTIKTKDLDINVSSNQMKSILNLEYWKRTDLTEEDAIKEFRLRAESKKYLEAMYKCKDCFVFYTKKETLERHVLMRHDESIGVHECRICRIRFKWKSHLRKHITAHYTKYECLRCHLVFNLENSAILHEQYHSGEKKKCPHCGEEFSHMTTYYTHVRSHRSCAVCRVCGAAFVSSAGLRQHVRKMHAQCMETDDDDDEVATFCAKCDITFDTKKAYEEHLFQSAKHTDFDVSDNEGVEIVYSKKILGKRLQEKIFNGLINCKDIEPPLPKVKKKRKIKRKHRKPTTCHQCGVQFSTQRACMQHHVSVHPRTSFYSHADRHICELCGVSLAPGSVSVHRNMHTRQQLHTCHTCGKQFHAAVGLKRHMLTHTGEKPFSCPLCDKRYTQSNSMKLHYRTAHLKQPYPDRYNKNIHKKKKTKKSTDIVQEVLPENSSESNHSNVGQNQPAPVLQTVLNTQPMLDDDVHYLTLE